MTQQYVFGSRIESDWQVGSSSAYTNEHGKASEGEVLEIDPPRRLV